MTAVAVQHGAPRQQHNLHRSNPAPNLNTPSGQQPQPQNHTFATAPNSQQLPHSGPAMNGMNGTLGTMNSRHTVSNDPIQPANGVEAGSAYAPANLDRSNSTSQNGSSTRPTTSAGATAESSQDDSEPDRIRRRPAALLQRSKSDYGPRGDDTNVDMEEDIQDWGERHGFGTNYASEEYVSQLANVSCSFLQ